MLVGAFASRDSLCAELSPGKGRGVVEIEASPADGAAVGAGVVLVLVAVLSSGVAAVVMSGELPNLLSAPVRKLRLQARCVPLLPGASSDGAGVGGTGRTAATLPAGPMKLPPRLLLTSSSPLTSCSSGTAVADSGTALTGRPAAPTDSTPADWTPTPTAPAGAAATAGAGIGSAPASGAGMICPCATKPPAAATLLSAGWPGECLAGSRPV